MPQSEVPEPAREGEYRRAEAYRVVTAIIARLGDGAGIDLVIRESLKELAIK